MMLDKDPSTTLGMTKNRTIGLLGGSFNPAHEGHLHITLYALKKLHLDEVWWLVSPHNPLKSSASLAAYEERLQSARDIAAAHKRIRVLDIEARLGTRYSWQIVAELKRRFPGVRFVWLMGADNLAQFHRWRRWVEILHKIPIIVFDRAPYSHTSLRGKTYTRAKRFLLKNNEIINLSTPPRFQFIHLKRDPCSSTAIRKNLKNTPF
jgi:nicotinate-nucleotide adenylyltransferase